MHIGGRELQADCLEEAASYKQPSLVWCWLALQAGSSRSPDPYWGPGATWVPACSTLCPCPPQQDMGTPGPW